MSLNHRALLYISLYLSSFFLFFFFSITTSRAALLLNYFIIKSRSCVGLGQNTHSKMKTALLKPRSRTMGEIFYVHNDDINTCVRNQQDYTLGLFEWVEEEIESENVWGGKKREGETIWLSRICGSYIFSNARGLTVNHLARFWICRLITAKYKASWHRGWRYIFF